MLAGKIHEGGTARAAQRPSNICRVTISLAIAYIEMPDENTVMTAKETAFRARVFSSKRRRRYSGTERAREP